MKDQENLAQREVLYEWINSRGKHVWAEMKFFEVGLLLCKLEVECCWQRRFWN